MSQRFSTQKILQDISMNAEIKEKWTAALRSGEYKQAYGSLKRNDRYCALGVLVDVTMKGDWDMLGVTSMTYAQAELDIRERAQIVDLNDRSKLPFTLIADYIERCF
jgi:hypothetical protein